MRRTLALLVLLAVAIAGTACGGSNGGSDKADNTRPTGGGSDRSTSAPATSPTATSATTTSATTTSAPSGPTTTTPEGGADTVLKPGDAPDPWSEASGEPLIVEALPSDGTSASAIPCPPQAPTAPGTSTQCTVYQDEGGLFVSSHVKAADGTETTTLFCLAGEAYSYEPTLTVTGRLAATGPGATDSEGRSLSAIAVEVDDGVHWYAIRRPASEKCPVVWDLGVDDGSLAASSSVGGATYPLADGPACVRLVEEGLLVKPGSADGICT